MSFGVTLQHAKCGRQSMERHIHLCRYIKSLIREINTPKRSSRESFFFACFGLLRFIRRRRRAASSEVLVTGRVRCAVVVSLPRVSRYYRFYFLPARPRRICMETSPVCFSGSSRRGYRDRQVKGTARKCAFGRDPCINILSTLDSKPCRYSHRILRTSQSSTLSRIRYIAAIF